jgi:hypothetical protein
MFSEKKKKEKKRIREIKKSSRKNFNDNKKQR